MSQQALVARPWTQRHDGLAVAIRLTPKSSRDGIDGIEHRADGRAVVKIRVRALPEAGAANAALIRLLAKALALPASAITLQSGATGRLKSLRLVGDASALAARLAAICGKDGA